MKPLESEPIITVTVITSFASALLALLVSFGLDISDDARNNLLLLIGIVAPIVIAVWGRSKAYAPDTVQDRVDEAFVEGMAGGVKPQV